MRNYRLEKIAVENEFDKLFEDYDENIQKFHSQAFVRLLRQEKREVEENKGMNREFSIAKILTGQFSLNYHELIEFRMGNVNLVKNNYLQKIVIY